MYHSLTAGIEQGDPQSTRAAVNVLAHKAAINGYKSGEVEVRVAPGPRRQPLPLFIEPFKAMMALLRAADRPDLALQPGGDADDPDLP
jgi:hypothetical protein